MTNKHLVEFLIKKRKELGFSQASVSKQMGRYPSYLGKVELFNKEMTANDLVLLCKIYKVSLKVAGDNYYN